MPGGLKHALGPHLRRAADSLARSRWLKRGRVLWEANLADLSLAGRAWSKWDKLHAGSYIILRDYADGLFPPRYPDREAVYRAEAAVPDRPGLPAEELLAGAMRKPHGNADSTAHHLGDFLHLHRAMEERGVRPPQRLLELGCGPGWLSELMALQGFDVTATSVRAEDREFIEKHAAAIRAKGLVVQLEFRECPMEFVGQKLTDVAPFQAVFVYEALHHAFSWEETIASVWKILEPGGWFFICGEPNVMHTFISYRVGRLLNWHEVGLSRRALRSRLRDCGFTEIKVLRNRFDDRVRPHWLAARRPLGG